MVPYLTGFPAAPQCHIHVTPCQGYQCTLKTHYLATCGLSQTFFPCFAAAFVLLRIHAGVQNRLIGLPKHGSETRVFPMAIYRVQTVIGRRQKRSSRVSLLTRVRTWDHTCVLYVMRTHGQLLTRNKAYWNELRYICSNS